MKNCVQLFIVSVSRLVLPSRELNRNLCCRRASCLTSRNAKKEEKKADMPEIYGEITLINYNVCDVDRVMLRQSDIKLQKRTVTRLDTRMVKHHVING